MLSHLGIDCDVPVTGHLAGFKASGIEFVCRYLPGGGKRKPLTQAEAKAISQAGMFVVSVFERGYPTTLGYFSYAHGLLHGALAAVGARKVGQPTGGVIYATVDSGTSGAAPALAYLIGFRAALKKRYKLGVYGPGNVCEAALAAGIVSYTWLAAASAWPGYKPFRDGRRWNLLQEFVDVTVGGVKCDKNMSNGDGGGWQIRVQ
jgi:hypothetical protein